MTDVASFVLCIQIRSEKPLTLYGESHDLAHTLLRFVFTFTKILDSTLSPFQL